MNIQPAQPQRPDQVLPRTGPPVVAPGPGNFITARIVVIFGTADGLFVYNGQPKAGNYPILAITTASTDPYGQGVTPQAITDDGMPLLIYSGTPQGVYGAGWFTF